MSYNILSIRSPRDEPDDLYPSIGNGGKTVTLFPSRDGADPAQFVAIDLSVWELRDDDRFHRLGHFGGARHTIMLTNRRTIVLSPNFKRADSSYLMFDMPGLYLASALTSAIKTHGRALTGQVMHYNVFKLSVLGTGRLKDVNQIRLYLRDETEDTERQIFLQITFRLHTDPRPIAQQMAHRIAGYWLSDTLRKTLDAERTAVLSKMLDAPKLEPTGDEWKSYHFPFSLGVAYKGKDRPVHKVPAMTRTERFAAMGSKCSPAFRWLDFSNGDPALPTGWGVSFTKTRSLKPSKEDSTALLGTCRSRGMYLADRTSHLPVESNGQARVLYSGSGMYLVTDDYLLAYLMHGNTLVGTVDRKDDAGRLIAATLLREISSIAVTSLVLTRDEGLVDRGEPAIVAVFSRDRTCGATWISDTTILAKNESGSKLEPLAIPALAEMLVEAVVTVTGDGAPVKIDVASGYIYDLSGRLSAQAHGGGPSANQTKCGYCGVGGGPSGYPCLACGFAID